MRQVQLKLREASAVLGVSPKELQNLVQFGVIEPKREDRFHVFDAGTLLQAKVAFYLKDSLGVSVPMLARFSKALAKHSRPTRTRPLSNVSIRSMPAQGPEAVRVEVPLMALAAELNSRLEQSTRGSSGTGTQSREEWRSAALRTFEAVSEELGDVSQAEIRKDIQSYRAEKRRVPEITVIAIS